MSDPRQGNLFDTGHYPHAPGYKEEMTSAQAAVSIQERATTLRGRIIALLGRHGFLSGKSARVWGLIKKGGGT